MVKYFSTCVIFISVLIVVSVPSQAYSVREFLTDINLPFNALKSIQTPGIAIQPYGEKSVFMATRMACVDMLGWDVKDNTPLQIDYNCNPWQVGWTSKWTFKGDGYDNLKINLTNSNYCIDYNGNKPGYGNQALLVKCNLPYATSWKMELLGDSVRFINKEDQRFCLDKDGNNSRRLQTWGCNGTKNQKFKLYSL